MWEETKNRQRKSENKAKTYSAPVLQKKRANDKRRKIKRWEFEIKRLGWRKRRKAKGGKPAPSPGFKFFTPRGGKGRRDRKGERGWGKIGRWFAGKRVGATKPRLPPLKKKQDMAQTSLDEKKKGNAQTEWGQRKRETIPSKGTVKKNADRAAGALKGRDNISDLRKKGPEGTIGDQGVGWGTLARKQKHGNEEKPGITPPNTPFGGVTNSGKRSGTGGEKKVEKKKKKK